MVSRAAKRWRRLSEGEVVIPGDRARWLGRTHYEDSDRLRRELDRFEGDRIRDAWPIEHRRELIGGTAGMIDPECDDDNREQWKLFVWRQEEVNDPTDPYHMV